jgi:hypothetical protein
MAYIIRHIDVGTMLSDIHKAEYDLRDNMLDGFSQFEIKKKLYKIKWELDLVLEKSTKFYGEEEWLIEQHKERMWRTLNK